MPLKQGNKKVKEKSNNLMKTIYRIHFITTGLGVLFVWVGGVVCLGFSFFFLKNFLTVIRAEFHMSKKKKKKKTKQQKPNKKLNKNHYRNVTNLALIFQISI